MAYKSVYVLGVFHTLEDYVKKTGLIAFFYSIEI